MMHSETLIFVNLPVSDRWNHPDFPRDEMDNQSGHKPSNRWRRHCLRSIPNPHFDPGYIWSSETSSGSLILLHDHPLQRFHNPIQRRLCLIGSLL